MEFNFHSSSLTPANEAKGITVQDVELALAGAQTAAQQQAKTTKEKDAVEAVFGAIQAALSAQDQDGQPTVEAFGKITEELTDVFVHVVVVPSGTLQQAKLDAGVAAAAAAQPAGVDAAGASTIAP